MKNYRKSWSLVDVMVIVAVVLGLGGAIASVAYMMLSGCNGFWVKDAFGIPRCVETNNVNILVH